MMIESIGIILAVLGSVLGLIGAWGTSSTKPEIRHFGFTCWIINSPMIVISLIGIATGLWAGLNAWCFVPLNLCYWYTAMRGYRNTTGVR
jgi:hypothetical protein